MSFVLPFDDAYYDELARQLQAPNTDRQLFKSIVNAPFADKMHAVMIDLGIIVLLLVNKKTQTIDRIALSDTEAARGAVRMSARPFHHIKIPLDYPHNVIARAIRTGKPQHTEDWRHLMAPAMSAQSAHFNQAGAGIEVSFVHALRGVRDGGALIFSFYQPLAAISDEHDTFMQRYTTLVEQSLQ